VVDIFIEPLAIRTPTVVTSSRAIRGYSQSSADAPTPGIPRSPAWPPHSQVPSRRRLTWWVSFLLPTVAHHRFDETNDLHIDGAISGCGDAAAYTHFRDRYRAMA